jgi:DNA-binding response OmpR family regulator
MSEKQKILVVDDNDAGRYFKVRTLQRAGYDVVQASDGRNGLYQAQAEEIAIAVLDVKLPDISGLDVCRIIKERDPSVLVLQTSATFRQMEHRIAGLEGGADSYLVEPMEPGELIATVQALLRIRKGEQDLRRSKDALETTVQERTHALGEANRKLREEIGHRAAAEETLRHTHKMDVLGQLTGSIAHDFNNLLAIILGNLETLRRRLPAEASELARYADNAFFGARRAVSLTKQLLTFARRTPMTPQVIKLGDSIGDITDLLRQAIGQRVSISTAVDPDVWPIFADPTGLETAILNLAVNARDAMKGEGAVVITIHNRTVAIGGSKGDLTPGEYVAICVTDTGKGMNPDVMKYAFEPFFTTKDVGDGTGLGLAQVHGFAVQAGGGAQIESELGTGTTVTIFLPRFTGEVVAPVAATDSEIVAGPMPDTTILIVEDNDHVRDYSAEILAELGYKIVQAHDARSALDVLANRKVHLLFSDLGLPGGIDGKDLALTALKRYPEVKVLLTTGYAGKAADVAPFPLIPKPYTFTDIGRKLREVLDLENRSSERARSDSNQSILRLRLLLVEDEALIRLDAADSLRECGFDVDEAASASQAREVMNDASRIIGGVIIDLGLPDLRGDELAAELRAARPSLPIIIASGFSSNEVRRRFREDSRTAFVDKPFSADQIRRALKAMRPQ